MFGLFGRRPNESRAYIQGLRAALRIVDEKKSWAYSSAKILDAIDDEKRSTTN